MRKTTHTGLIKTISSELGFDYCGIARAEKLDQDARRLENWLNKGMHGKMKYMENYFDMRIDPTRLLPEARSVITLLLNYYPAIQPNQKGPKISKYAYGKDYHLVIKSKLQTLAKRMKEGVGNFSGRGFVDSAPVLERSWAQRSGLGWVGRNGNLINKNSGSFFFIATLITDLELDYDDPMAKDYCGTCRKCIEACPTEAILDDRLVDGSRCISYFTIELKDKIIPENMHGRFDDWVFGCDTCQDVCPWNRFSKPNLEPELEPLKEILEFSLKDWEELKEEGFREIFSKSPLKRAGFQGIKRNLQFIRRLS